MATHPQGGGVLMDLLWSDPTTNDGVVGVQPSPRGPGLVTFGPDRVKEFCKVGAGFCRVLGVSFWVEGSTLTFPFTPLSHNCPDVHPTEQRAADDCARARVRDGWL